MGSKALRIISRTTVTCVFAVLASLSISWLVLHGTSGSLDGRALILTIACPLLIGGPMSALQFWQNERLREARAVALEMNGELETLHAALVEAHAALAEKARSDALTGLLNREGFFAEVEAIASAGGGLLMIDVDHFKRINDTFGHLDGDKALREIARRITSTVGSDGVVGRIGGEEFTVFLAGGSAETVERTSADICRAVEAGEIRAADGRPLRLSVSIGGAWHPPDADIHATLSLADRCLYEAKEGGRNRAIVSAGRQAAA